MSTKNNPGSFDCYEDLDPDEPYFVLRGNDPHAPTIIWLWAALRELDDENPAKVREARQCMAEMLQWGADHHRKHAGLGQVALAAVMELIRTCNTAVGREPPNTPTSEDMIRRALAVTTFEKVQPNTTNEPS